MHLPAKATMSSHLACAVALRPALILALGALVISACGAGNSTSPVKEESIKPVREESIKQDSSGDSAEWRLAFVSSDYAWHMSEAQGVLKRNGDQLTGVLLDPKDPNAKVEITINLNANNATARFKMSPEVDEQFQTVSGTYRKLSPAGQKGCVEQINLINDHEYIGLFRDYDCKP
jgi:hypothetical protein